MRFLVVTMLVALAALPARAQDAGAPPDGAAPTPTGAIVPPEIVEDAQPLYPEDAFRDGVHGEVLLDLDIDDEGVVQRASIKSAPDPRLAWAALGAVTNMSFVAATQDGKPIFVRIEYRLAFTIDEVERERLLEAEEARRLALAKETAPINLRGRVLVAGERLAVPGAFVSVLDTELEAVSNDDGFFEIKGVPEGKRTIHVEASGYLPGEIIETIEPHVVVDVNLFLVRKPGVQDETVVYERRTQREVTKRVLTQKELQRVPGTFGDAVRVVQRLPGVARAPFGLGAVLIRGGAPEDSTILIDGHLTRLLFHLGAGPSVINTDLVERLELYPGGQGAKFGRAIAGAVDVVTRDPRLDTYSGKATVDLLQTSFRLEGPIVANKIGFFAAGRTSYVAEVLNVGDTVGRFIDLGVSDLTLAPRYADYQGKLFMKLPYHQTVSLNLFGSHDDLDLAFDPSTLGPNAPSNVGITLGFHRFNPVWKFATPEKNPDGSPKLRAWVSPAFETNYSENRFDVSQFRLDVLRASLRAEIELRPVDGLGLTLGTDNTVANFRSSTDVPVFLPDERLFPRPVTSDPPRFILDAEVLGTSYSFYVEGDAKLGDLLIVAGGRADLFTYYDEVRTAFDPRLAARFELLRHVTLKGSAGQYHQTASPFELAKTFGNPELPLEKGWQGSIGAEVQLTRSLDIDAQIFGRTADDLADFVVSPVAFFASGAQRIQPIAHERVYGAELLLRQRLDKAVPWGNVFGWVAYTLMRAEERFDKPVGIEGAEEFGWSPGTFDQTHILSIAASSEVMWGFELGAALRYVTGNPATVAQQGIFDGDTSGHQRVNGPYRNSRLPPFFQVDVRVDKKFTFDTWALNLYCDLQNATNATNYEFFQYNYDYTVVEGFPGLPIIPVIGAEASF